MCLLSEQNIFFGNKPMDFCAYMIFFSSFKMTFKMTLESARRVDACYAVLKDT
jgi:hypothetical protein